MKKDLLPSNKADNKRRSSCESSEVLFFEKPTDNLNVKDDQYFDPYKELDSVNPALLKMASNLNFLKSLGLDNNIYEKQKEKIITLFELEMDNQLQDETYVQMQRAQIIKSKVQTIQLLKDISKTEDHKEDFSNLTKNLYCLRIIISFNIKALKSKGHQLKEITEGEYSNTILSYRDKRDFTPSQQKELNKAKNIFYTCINNYLVKYKDWSVLDLENMSDEDLDLIGEIIL